MNDATPLIAQYLVIKQKYTAEFVFFQVGDFYELFFDDALNVSSLLSITLTKRGSYMGQPIPLCGVPVHMAEPYCTKLVNMGYTVVICDQTEEAQPGKLVNRQVSSIISPGTLLYDTASSVQQDSSIAFLYQENETTTCLFFSLLHKKISLAISTEKNHLLLLCQDRKSVV